MDKVQSLIRNHQVMIFSKSYCRFCNKVKQIFSQENVKFHSVELDLMDGEGTSMQAALSELTQMRTVPNVFIRGEHIGGCDATENIYRDGTLLERVSGRYKKRDYQLIVIGGGSGGLAAAKEAASLGCKVAVCDFVKPTPKGTKWGLGGTCVNVGCIPKKLMHKSAIIGSDMKDAPHFGWQVAENVEHSWEKLAQEVKRYIMSLNFGYRSELMLKKIDYLNAFAKFTDRHTVEITDRNSKTRSVTSDNFLIAVGGRPTYPDIPGAVEYGITSDDVFYLQYNPGKTLVVGGSYVALECAGFLAGFGLDVTVMVRSILLRGFDQQMAEMIGEHMKSHGVKFIRPAVPLQLRQIKAGEPGELSVSIKHEDGSVTEEVFNTVLFATGRKACTSNIGLEKIGIQLNASNGKIVTDKLECTNVRNVFAIGDVLDGKPELTPVAIQAGRLLAKKFRRAYPLNSHTFKTAVLGVTDVQFGQLTVRLYGKSDTEMDYKMVPTTVFTPLEYGCVGYSEEDAIGKFGKDDIEVYHTHFQPLEYTLPERDKNLSYGKLICVKSEEERVVGLHILGPNAGEITQGFALAMRLGAKKQDFNDVVGIHPTCAEVFTTMFVTKASGIDVKKSSC